MGLLEAHAALGGKIAVVVGGADGVKRSLGGRSDSALLFLVSGLRAPSPA